MCEMAGGSAIAAGRTMPGVLMNPTGEKENVLVTFQRKDLRKDPASDKWEIARRMVGGEPHLDVNLYDAPILGLYATAQEIERLRNDPDVAVVERDALFGRLGGAPGGAAAPLAETVPAGVAQIGAPSAWDASRGKGIRVAVVDSGIDATHPDLKANVKAAVSFVPGETPSDGNGHGTHMAGIIAAAENGSGIIGVAPAAWLYGVKVLGNNGSGQWAWVISGIQWCIAKKMQIVCLPLGGATAPAALEAICDAAFANGLLVIATAGNGGATGSVAVPARYKNVIAVSSVDGSDIITPFSGRGPEIEICAPGVNVLSTKAGGGYQTWSGTASACAHAAGAAAVAWGSHRFASNAQIWNLLAGTARPLGGPGWDPLYGYGRVQADGAALAPAPLPNAALRP
jgi:subtilisin